MEESLIILKNLRQKNLFLFRSTPSYLVYGFWFQTAFVRQFEEVLGDIYWPTKVGCGFEFVLKLCAISDIIEYFHIVWLQLAQINQKIFWCRWGQDEPAGEGGGLDSFMNMQWSILKKNDFFKKYIKTKIQNFIFALKAEGEWKKKGAAWRLENYFFQCHILCLSTVLNI